MDITNKQINVVRMSSLGSADQTIVLVEIFTVISDDLRRLTDCLELKIDGFYTTPVDPTLYAAITQRLLEI
jgi:hypothetical protein